MNTSMVFSSEKYMLDNQYYSFGTSPIKPLDLMPRPLSQQGRPEHFSDTWRGNLRQQQADWSFACIRFSLIVCAICFQRSV